MVLSEEMLQEIKRDDEIKKIALRKPVENKFDTEEISKKGKNFVHLLQDLSFKNEKLSDHEMVYSLAVFLTVGHEMNGNTLSWALFILAIAPEKQERIFNLVNKQLPENFS